VGSDLAVEAWGPAAGDCGGAVGATAVGGEAVIFDEIALALDQSLAALRTARVLPIADHARKIAGVDVAQAGLAADIDGAQEVVGGGVARDIVLHFVVAVKSRDVPGNVGRDAGEEFGEAAQFVGGIVEAGDEQRDDLKPQAHLVDAADALENGRDAAAEFVVVAIVEAFEIDFIQVEPGPHVVEHLWGSVAIGDEGGEQTCGFRLFENGDGPFAGDQRLVVGADHGFRALSEGFFDQRFRRSPERRRDRVGIAQGLGRDPVLTIPTVQIATQHAETVGESARMGVKERLLLDGITLRSGNVSPGDVEFSTAVVANLADAGLTLEDGTAMSAGKAADAIFVEGLVEVRIGFANSIIENGAKGGHGFLAPF
jgi:hypothetical protein